MGVDLFLSGTGSGMLCGAFLICTLFPKLRVKKKKKLCGSLGEDKEFDFNKITRPHNLQELDLVSILRSTGNVQSKDALR